MDLQRAAKPGSPNSLLGVPEYILNTFFPGTLPLLARSPKFAKLISLVLALWWVGPSAYLRLKQVIESMSSFFVSSICVSSDEDLFEYMVRWLATQRTIRKEHSLVASLSNHSPNRRRNPYFPGGVDEVSPQEDPRNVEIQYESSHGLQLLLFKRRLFFLRRDFGEGNVYNGGKSHRMEILTVSCIGRSTQPVKDLLEEVYHQHKDKEKSLTIIRRPYGVNYGRNGWSRISQKPRRAIDTVILKATQKAEVLSDIEAYIDPSTQSWYGARGIPYRRGYLFHGEPGTGKTSLAMAIAGRYGLDIYVISLLDMSIGDSELIGLFNTLPPKCLLLLEDIDTVGLQRESPSSRRDRPHWPKALAKMEKGEEDEEEEKPELSRVSLSGLLNAIDGVAAPEGHILIMTTNKPEKLDEALIRSGRISVRVGFEKATGEQARDIFMRMYWHEEEGSANDRSQKGAQSTTTDEYARMAALAQQFGERIPDHMFSPADLQDFLLTRRKDPQRAIDELEEWKVKTIEDRAKKAEDDAKRRKERADKTKRKMAEMMAMSGEMQGALSSGGMHFGAFVVDKSKIKEGSEESRATTLVGEAAQAPDTGISKGRRSSSA